MTRISKYLNPDTIAALQSFQIEKIDREITYFSFSPKSIQME